MRKMKRDTAGKGRENKSIKDEEKKKNREAERGEERVSWSIMDGSDGGGDGADRGGAGLHLLAMRQHVCFPHRLPESTQ